MPIRLWSTVEIQLQKPCSLFGRANGRAGARVTATAMVGLLFERLSPPLSGGRPLSPGRSRSLESGQERYELVDLGVGQVRAGLGQVRHPGALVGPHRLHGRRVVDPPVQVLGRDV